MMWLLLAVLAVIIKLSKAQPCMNGTVRLQNGPTEFEGRVEVCLSEEWRTVCNDFWGPNEALVVCRQLGFSTSGFEQFVDLRSTGGPDVGIDNSNCTGMEERLVDCRFSREVSDCNSNPHKVGVRCHEERAPKNLRIFVNEVMLRVDWEAPENGITSEQIQSYTVECSFMDGIEAYTLKHSVADDIFKVFLPIRANLSTAGYNCCVEAIFETYSSRACIATPSLLIVKDNQQQVICPHKRTIQIVAGVLAFVIVFLLIMLVTVLIYLWRSMIQQSKEKCPKSAPVYVAQSGTEPGRAQENQLYEENGPRIATSSKTPLGRYSTIGPEYEPIQTAVTKRGGNQSTNRDHHLIPDSKIILRPASYEIPISSDIQTLNSL